ncbi:MAG: type IV toxin-antitoxin system AbiEi family antitoxin [Verrucomicrobia bacterium]|nr:type IV toxin-antitoxin system AbiEi family antitoxin [Verrucomicrobiota bacterium]
MSFKNYIDTLASTGKYFFTQDEALTSLGITKSALNSSLRRLKTKNEIASPLKGFFIIIPPEYRSLGALPPEEFIDNLMQHLNLPYYVGLQSAAQYYGAAHQKPQSFQVIIPKTRREIRIGKVKIVFITKSDAAVSPTRQFNTPRGYIRIATPELLAVDLVTFSHRSGGISEAYNILSELSENLKLEEFAQALHHVKKAPPIQRLGYFFDCLGLVEFEQTCEAALKKHPYVRKATLDPQSPSTGAVLNEKWNLLINIDLEVENDT